MMRRAWLPVVFTLLPVVARAAPVELTVEGLEGELLKNVRAYTDSDVNIDTRRQARSYVDQVTGQAKEALQALGHYQPKLSNAINRDDEGWHIQLTIEPGPSVELRNVRIELRGEGADDDAFEQVRSRIPLEQGQTLNHGQYESAKSLLVSTAINRGYFNQAFETSQIKVNPSAGWADITLVFDTGPRYALGGLSFSDVALKQGLLERLAKWDANTPYHADKIAALNKRLSDSGYFRNVRLRVDRAAAGKQRRIPVTADLSMREPNSIGTGIGYSTDVGPRARLSWERHWVNSSGHQFNADLRVSPVQQDLSAVYSIPLSDPINDHLEFTAGVQAQDLDDTKSQRFTVGVQRTQEFSSGWQRVQSLRYLYEDFEQGNDEAKTGLLLPGLAFSRTRSRGSPDPYWGDSQSYGIEVADDRLLSDATLTRLTASGKLLRRFYQNHRVLLRAEGGAMFTGDFDEVPASLRFFAGGGQSVRGYEYQSLAPEDSDGDLLGGRYLLVGSAEYQYSVIENWRGAVFVDAGNAFDDYDETDYKVGTGVGVRWASPVGPVRLDFAFGVSESGNPFRIHFSLGPPF